MDQEIKVSVICNVFNHGAYIRDALEGFVSQKTDFAFEVLIHDDASTDDSPRIIREYEEKYPQLIKPVLQTENQYSRGGGITRRFQLPRAKGKYLAMCEGDDYWTDPLKLQKQFDFMEAHPDYSMCVCSTQWLNMHTGICENKGVVEQDRDFSLEEIILEKKGRAFQYASVFVKAEIMNSWPEWRRKFPIGDYPLAVLAALNGKVHMLADVMTVYRYFAANSWTARMDSDEKRTKVCRRMIEGLEALDEATQGRYHDVIMQRICRQKYTLALMTHDLKLLRSEELKTIYGSRKLLFRMSDVLRCRFPGMYTKLLKPLAKAMKSGYGE